MIKKWGFPSIILFLPALVHAQKKLPHLLAMIFIGFFALFHGYAHGNEMPQIAHPALYTLGFISGIAGLHICGVLIGLIFQEFKQGEKILRVAGLGITGVGLRLLMQ